MDLTPPAEPRPTPPAEPRSSSAARAAEAHAGRRLSASGQAAAPSFNAAMKTVHLFNSLSDEALARIEEQATFKTFAEGEILCTEGDAAKCCFVIVNGSVAVIKAIEEAVSLSTTSQDTALSASVCSRRESIQAVTGSGSIVSNNPMHADNAQILKAINIQTQEMHAQTKAMNAQSQAMTKAIIEGQQKTSHDLAVNLAKILKEEKA